MDSKINGLHQKYNEQIERLGYDKKIENLNSIVKLNEIIYHTYIYYNQNYFNCINLNNLLINYYKNENIKNNVIKKILKDNYKKVTKLIMERKNEYNYENKEEDQKKSESDKIRILEMENKKLKEQMEKRDNDLGQKEINQKSGHNMTLDDEIDKRNEEIISSNDSAPTAFNNNN